MKNTFDILIVGAGTGGSVAAITAAKNGFDVCLIDSKQKSKIGDKVCGDIIWKEYFDVLRRRIGIDHPAGKELNQIVRGIKIISPDRKTSISIGNDHYMVNRHMFGQRLVEKAMEEGATLLDGLIAIEPIINDNFVVGVVAKDRYNNEISKICGKIVIDASGALPALRNKVMLENSFLETNVLKSDMAVAYREVRSLKHDDVDNDFAKIYLSNELIPGGYIWYFPDGNCVVNVGIGTAMSSKDAHIRRRFDKYILSNEIFKDSAVITKGGGVLPTRMPLCSMVANGFMCVGDAACQVNPVSGAGIEFSMDGGHFAATTAMSAIINDDVSQEMLWSYNEKYMSVHGATQTSIDIFRIFLDSVSDSDLNFGLKHLMTEKAIIDINGGEGFNMSPSEISKILLKSIGRLKFINKFKRVLENMQKAKKLCENYPQPIEFTDWKKELDDIYNDAHKIIK